MLAGLVWGASRGLQLARPVGLAKDLVRELSFVRHGARVEGRSEEPLVRLRRGLETCRQPDGLHLGRHILMESGDAYESYLAPTLRRILRLSVLTGPASLTPALALAMFRADRHMRQVLTALKREETKANIPVPPGGHAGSDRDRLLQSPRAPGDGLTAACAAAARSLARLEALLLRLNNAAVSRLKADPCVEVAAAAAAVQRRLDEAGVELAGIEVRGRIGVTVFIEPAALRRSMHDILVNAIEACHEAANPKVGIRIVGGERKVIIQVIDNGKGIAPENWESIFHGKSMKQPKGGTGLLRARQAIESCSGRIFVAESTAWERTVIEIELCRAAS